MTPAVHQIYETDLGWRGWNKDSMSHMTTVVPGDTYDTTCEITDPASLSEEKCGEAGLRTSSCEADIALTGIRFLTKLFYRSRTNMQTLQHTFVLRLEICSVRSWSSSFWCDGLSQPWNHSRLWSASDKRWELRSEKEKRQMNWSLTWSQACETSAGWVRPLHPWNHAQHAKADFYLMLAGRMLLLFAALQL